MKITINGQDYTITLDAANPLKITRTLNEPSVCDFSLYLLQDGSLASPIRNQPVAVTGDDGMIYFTGYIAATPVPEYVGVGVSGPRYRTVIQAVSDELLLDQVLMSSSKGAAGLSAGSLLTNLVTRTGSSHLCTAGVNLTAPISQFASTPGATWSKSAGMVASQARAAYRVHNGTLTLTPAQTTVHTLNEADESLCLADLTLSSGVKRSLANDITVCGQHEPTSYVTEYLLGDGVTNTFYLSASPFVMSSSKSSIIHELFDQAQIDGTNWSDTGGSGYFSIGNNGLSMQGGNGVDGQSVLSWLDPVEVSGTLLFEAVGVSLSPGSTGVIAGFFTGLLSQSSCTAGFQVSAQPGSGTVSIQPLVQGLASGSSYTINPSNQYTLRVRIHCPEMQRAQNIYRSFGDAGAITVGGQWNLSPGCLLFELQECSNGVLGVPIVLYDGVLTNLPGVCTVAVASSVNLVGSVRSVTLSNLGSGWVVTTPAGGSTHTRRMGSAIQSAECYIEGTGKLVFYPGSTPAVGEQIVAHYRRVGRSIGRYVNASCQSALAAESLPSAIAWCGTVTEPAPRSSQDCRNAAAVIGEAAASVSALWKGNYRGTKLCFTSDVWPGDALLLDAPSTHLNAQVVIRSVNLTYHPGYQDQVFYDIAFANDWADDLAIHASTSVPTDARLPAAAGIAPIANLSALTVTALSGSTVTVNTGSIAPPGGGFEIRRRDNAFMPGEDPSLVIRSSQPNLTFSRLSMSERYFVRMYDGSNPPNYSEFSAALLLNLPLGS